MDLKLFDPTIPRQVEKISYAPRPKNLVNLRVALVENSKHNSKAILLKIFELLKSKFKMQLVGVYSKESAGHKISDEAIADFKNKTDIAIAGIGD